jgi:hypothetical protein
LQCKSCGDPVDPRRVELGYDYCLKEDCQQQCLKPVELAALGVNKAADYYVRADEVLPARPLATTLVEPDEPERLVRRPSTVRPERPMTTLDRLRQHEVELDRALEHRYERFRHGEITARELDLERDQLIGAFNRQVRAENIRYRSLLRRRPNGDS